MRIFGMGIPELIIIVLIICVLFGPMLFKKINKQVKETGKAAKKGIENGAKAAGKDVDLDHVDKKSVLDHVEKLQDRVDKMFEDDEDEPQATPPEQDTSQKADASKDDASQEADEPQEKAQG